MDTDSIIYIIDSNPEDLALTSKMVSAWGIESKCYVSCEDYLAKEISSHPACLLVDHDLANRVGLDFIKTLRSRGDLVTYIVLARDATVPMAVRYLQNGAASVIEKPCKNDELKLAVEYAIKIDAHRKELHQRFLQLKSAKRELNERENLVMESVINGKLNKMIAKDLNLSVRTIENVRSKVLRKFQAQNAPELAAKAIELEYLSEKLFRNGLFNR